ncbi:hypothetical protein HK102_006772 [Quaeritorhiza haematococci]|nr:hypothetical protein HK102_006772 [Quaeritorhiza haematococci]
MTTAKLPLQQVLDLASSHRCTFCAYDELTGLPLEDDDEEELSLSDPPRENETSITTILSNLYTLQDQLHQLEKDLLERRLHISTFGSATKSAELGTQCTTLSRLSDHLDRVLENMDLIVDRLEEPIPDQSLILNPKQQGMLYDLFPRMLEGMHASAGIIDLTSFICSLRISGTDLEKTLNLPDSISTNYTRFVQGLDRVQNALSKMYSEVKGEVGGGSGE